MKNMLLNGFESIIVLLASILTGSFFYNFFQQTTLGLIVCAVIVIIGTFYSKEVLA